MLKEIYANIESQQYSETEDLCDDSEHGEDILSTKEDNNN